MKKEVRYYARTTRDRSDVTRVCEQRERERDEEIQGKIEVIKRDTREEKQKERNKMDQKKRDSRNIGRK